MRTALGIGNAVVTVNVTVNVTRSVENRKFSRAYIAVWPAVGPYHPVWGERVIVERAVVVTASVTGYSIWRVSQC